MSEKEVGFHSIIKHEFIKRYFKIYTDIVGSPKNVKANKPIPSLQIFDLYAASGICELPLRKEFGYGDDIWDGSALLSAKCIANYIKGDYLFLNSWSPDEFRRRENIESLKENLQNLSDWIKIKHKVEIFSADVIDAFNYAKTKANKEFPTVWILDPYDPKQLPWNVVEGIASLESQNYTYNDGSKRRPELIINLFTSYIQRFSDNNPELLSIALGMKKEEWEPLFKEYLADSTNKLEAILKLYSKRLSEYYKKPPITILVKDISNRVVVYCIIFCSEHKAAYYQVLINEIRELDKYIIEELQPEAEMIRKRKKMGKEQRDLFSFT